MSHDAAAPTPRRAVCIVNPNSGSGRTGARWPQLALAMAAAGLEVDARLTSAPGEGTALAAAALREGAELVVAVGGDGTIHEVANGFLDAAGVPLRPGARLGIVPAGSGSDLIKTLGIPADPRAAIARLATGRARPHDMTRVQCLRPDGSVAARWSINVASVGMAAHVLAKMAALPGWLLGQARYLTGSLLGFADLRPFPVVVTVDGSEHYRGQALLVTFGTGRCFGAGMQIMPDAVPDDGLLDVTIIEARGTLELLANFPRIFAGTHVKLPWVRTARGRSITLETAAEVELDGEIAGVGPVVAEVAAGALQVIA